MDGGTLVQLRDLLNRRNVVKDPSKDVIACEEFISFAMYRRTTAALANAATVHVGTKCEEISGECQRI